ncbi:YncE family protein [Caulobacter soli]|uniref:YncE family protein n=1 Tax=Caulobacter soli TaxID=2708539 RepID=UPI0013EC4AD1|nr:YncE family protein [Caulobacter soli]
MKTKLLAASLLALITATTTQALAAAAPAPMKIVDRIAGPDGGWDYANFDPVHRRLYVAHGAAVTAIDVDTGKVTPALVAAQHAHIALPLPGGDELLVTNGANDTATLVDALTGAVRATVSTGQNPDAALFDPASGLAFVMNGRSGDITLIDTKAAKAVGAIPVGGKLEFGATDGQGRVFVNVEDKNEIAVIDTAARKVVAHWAMAGCEEPSGLAYVADDHLLIAACANGKAEVVSSTSGTVVASLAVGEEPDAAFYDAQRHLAYVPSGGDGTLSVIAVRGPTDVAVIGKMATKPGARTGALDPVTGRVYLPSADYAPPAQPGGRRVAKSGTFAVLVLGR